MKVDTGTWADDAACKGLSHLFFQAATTGTFDHKIEARAIKTCNRCAVIQQCRTYALNANERFGVWGGMTPKQLVDERMRLGILESTR
jgi:WhiB family transcriptional regulator, redox-sensing transcriptional regulator